MEESTSAGSVHTSTSKHHHPTSSNTNHNPSDASTDQPAQASPPSPRPAASTPCINRPPSPMSGNNTAACCGSSTSPTATTTYNCCMTCRSSTSRPRQRTNHHHHHHHNHHRMPQDSAASSSRQYNKQPNISSMNNDNNNNHSRNQYSTCQADIDAIFSAADGALQAFWRSAIAMTSVDLEASAGEAAHYHVQSAARSQAAAAIAWILAAASVVLQEDFDDHGADNPHVDRMHSPDLVPTRSGRSTGAAAVLSRDLALRHACRDLSTTNTSYSASRSPRSSHMRNGGPGVNRLRQRWEWRPVLTPQSPNAPSQEPSSPFQETIFSSKESCDHSNIGSIPLYNISAPDATTTPTTHCSNDTLGASNIDNTSICKSQYFGTSNSPLSTSLPLSTLFPSYIGYTFNLNRARLKLDQDEHADNTYTLQSRETQPNEKQVESIGSEVPSELETSTISYETILESQNKSWLASPLETIEETQTLAIPNCHVEPRTLSYPLPEDITIEILSQNDDEKTDESTPHDGNTNTISMEEINKSLDCNDIITTVQGSKNHKKHLKRKLRKAMANQV